MDAKEFRIGNYVNYKDRVVKAATISVTGEELNFAYEEINGGYDYTDIRLFKPIPLTEEWLVKFGFDKSDEYGDFICQNEGDVVYLENDDLGYYISFGKDPMFCILGYGGLSYIKHVHQLLNLYYALCQEELTLTKNK